MNKSLIKVLLVENSKVISLQIKSFLNDDFIVDFKLFQQSKLKGAIKLLREEQVDVILLNPDLPDSNGLETFEKINRLFPHIATVVFTKESDEAMTLDAIKYGAQDYLVKGQSNGKILCRTLQYSVERKQLEIKLRDSEAKHRALLEAMPDIIYRLDTDGILTYLNPSIEKLGYCAEDLIGKHFSKIIHPNDLSKISRKSALPAKSKDATDHSMTPQFSPQFIDERRTGNRVTTNLLLRMIPKNWTGNNDSSCVFGSLTSYGEVTATGQYMTNKSNNVKKFNGTIGIIKDVTDRKRAEDDKATLEMQLHQSQKMEAIGVLAGGIAHDMNNVLGAIQGSTSLIDLETNDDSDIKPDLANILIACKKGRDLTRDLLGFARKGKYVKESISPNRIAYDVKSLLSRTISKKINFQIDFDRNVNNIDGDQSQIQHALMNIAINAADAIDKDGQITISTKNISIKEPKDMRLRSLPSGKYVKISVKDDGCGIDPSIMNKIFEPFFTTKPTGGGTGLGLSMVYGVIENHNGVVIIDSTQNVGTIVSVILPAGKKTEKTTISTNPISPNADSLSGSILIVDDEPVIRTSVKRLLRKLGYTIFLAENGVDAIKQYQKHSDKITLILLDMMMPVLDGEETFYQLRKINPSLKILLFSGYAKNNTVEALIENGAMGFIQKPFDIWVFSNALKKAILK